jgi:CRISPR-associated endonuclease Csy4
VDHYVDILVRPDPEFASHQLMEALYAKLHRALVAQKSTRIGVSFPDFSLRGPHLGMRLRLHGEHEPLSALLARDWMIGMRDHVALTPPTPVPDSVQHRIVRRVQAKSNPERLRRRLMHRHPIDAAEARRRIPDERGQTLNLPFVQLRSASTGQSFRLFVDHGPLQAHATAGDFNAYGLSQTATTPWF